MSLNFLRLLRLKKECFENNMNFFAKLNFHVGDLFAALTRRKKTKFANKSNGKFCVEQRLFYIRLPLFLSSI